MEEQVKEAPHGRGQGSDKVEETGGKKKSEWGCVKGEHSRANPLTHTPTHPASGRTTLALGRSARIPKQQSLGGVAPLLDQSRKQ